MKTHQMITTLAFVVAALWLSACGNTDPAGYSRNQLGNFSGNMSVQDTTVQSTGGLSCTAVANPSSIKTGGTTNITLTVSGASGTITIPQANVANSSQTSFPFNTVLNLNSGVSANFAGTFNVVDAAGNTAACTYHVTVSR